MAVALAHEENKQGTRGFVNPFRRVALARRLPLSSFVPL
jgi:hypothetical protein